MWNLEGKHVSGNYMGEFPVSGIVTESRPRRDGVIHYVKMDNSLTMPWRVIEEGEMVILEENCIVEVYEN